ncbi:MAG: aminoacyl-tRNA hydrolase [Candidatus Pacebacteria bacterium]|nr:aminoacyl-tRNA hydrolase [Candidatus Paceibacterota bacterium]
MADFNSERKCNCPLVERIHKYFKFLNCSCRSGIPREAILIIGLGNPGEKYQKTPHNVGQQAVDALQENWQKYGFSNWERKTKFKAEISRGEINNQKIFLVKPFTYMNDSGLPAVILKKYYKIKPENFWVIHDDVDLKIGTMKIIRDRSSGGHKGVASIIQNLKTKNIARFKIGICPEDKKPENMREYVLKALNKKQEKILKDIYPKVSESIEVAISESVEKAMNKFN